MLYHQPVLLTESVAALNIQPNGIYVDATFGGGGHSKAILEQLSPQGRLFAFDQDADALQNEIEDSRFKLIHNNFKYIKKILRIEGVFAVNGILADLGVSWHQFDTPDRGFSFRFEDCELDMRMNQQLNTTAKDILNTYTEAKLTQIFRENSDIVNARKLAQIIVNERDTQNFETVLQLKTIAEKNATHKPNQYLAQVFQALRMEVNAEAEALGLFLEQSAELLAKKGSMVIISYHSIEDRLVKNFMKTGNCAGVVQKNDFGQIINPPLLTPFPKNIITPTEIEQQQNPKSRSAKMRVGIKI